MKRSNKKGFTIVELVIVIAVIAILAAVLIPTIAGLVRDANISADTVLARELNKILAEENAKDDSADADFEAVLATLRNRGYYISNLNARADECYFVWDKQSKQILLVDGRVEDGEDYKVLYSNKDYDADNAKTNWYFAISDAMLANGVKDDGFTNVKQPINTAEELKEIIATANGEGEVTVLINQNFSVNKDEYIEFDNENANIVLDLGGKTITADYLMNAIPYFVSGGSVSFTNGTIKGTSSAEVWDNYCVLIYGSNEGKVNIKDVTISLLASEDSGRNIGIYSVNGGTVNVSDTVVYAGNGNPIQCYGGTMTLTNVTVDQTGSSEKSFYDAAIQVINGFGEYAQYDAHLTVNSGTYNGKIALQMSQPGGTVVINGGTFTGETAIQIDTGAYADRDHSVTINGGTFNGDIVIGNGATFIVNGGTFNCTKITIDNTTYDLTDDEAWDVFSQYVTAGKTVTLNGTTYTKGA